eukprot:1486582-Rhodomonas_salina.1
MFAFITSSLREKADTSVALPSPPLPSPLFNLGPLLLSPCLLTSQESVVEECALEGGRGVLLHDLFAIVAKSRSICIRSACLLCCLAPPSLRHYLSTHAAHGTISAPLQSLLWKRMRTLATLEFTFDSPDGAIILVHPATKHNTPQSACSLLFRAFAFAEDALASASASRFALQPTRLCLV